MKEIIVCQDEKKDRKAYLMEDNILVEQYYENCEKGRIEGNIYVGIIQKILPGLQAAFVDIGKKRNVFLHIKDLLPKQSNETGNKNENFKEIDIKDYIKVGKKILVQIKKDECQGKSAKATTHIKLSGRFTVLIPNVNFTTISSKIEDEKEIKRLKQIIKDNKKEDIGVIIRTSAISKQKDEIIQDMQNLNNIWSKIYIKFKEIEFNRDTKPNLVYRNYDITKKLILDVMDKDLSKITVNSGALYHEILDFIKEYNIRDIDIELNENIPASGINNILKQAQKATERKIWLKCGGFITIDKTEALTAIDVNSGKYIGNDLKNAFIDVNKQATLEIAKQVRLRDIGGIIIVDYIEMNEESQKEIIDIWNKCLKLDRAKVQIIGFTPLNLLEITRKHMWS